MNRRRMSRRLLGLCLITLVFGLVAYVMHAGRSVSGKPPAMQAAAAPTGGPGSAGVGSSLGTTTRPARTTPPSALSDGGRPGIVASTTITPTSNTRKTSISGSVGPNAAGMTGGTGSVANGAPAGGARLVSDSGGIPTAGGAAITAAWSPTPDALPAAPPANFIAVAAAKSNAGDLLGARKLLNDALLSGKLNAFDTEATKKSISDLNSQIIFSSHRYPDDEYGGTHMVRPGELLKKIADSYDVPWPFLATINNLANGNRMRSGAPLKIIKGPFTVVVSKKAFTLDLYLGGTPGHPGSMYVRSYPVGLGREDSTPTGTWMVGTKAMNPVYYSPRGEGVIAADDPKNPLGHRWISLVGMDGKALGAQSYGIHGTIDPDSIGKQASMGCIRMHNEDVAVVFDLLAPGKSIVIVKN